MFRFLKGIMHTHQFEKKWELNDGLRSSVGLQCKKCRKRQIITTTGYYLIKDLSLWDYAATKGANTNFVMSNPQNISDGKRKAEEALCSVVEKRVNEVLRRKNANVFSDQVEIDIIFEEETEELLGKVYNQIRRDFLYER